MNLLRLLPVILSFLLLAAHFLRAGWPALSVLCLALLPLLMLRRWWVPPLFQALLLLGAVEWLRTLAMLVLMRIAQQQDWGRATMILLPVAVLTALSALVFRSAGLRQRYPDP